MIFNTFKNINLIIPELFLGTSILVLILYGSAILTKKKKNHHLFIRSIQNLAILTLLLEIMFLFNDPISVEVSAFNQTILKDSLSSTTKMIILISSLFCLLISQNYINHQKLNNFEYIIITLLAILGLILLCSSNDLITVYLAIELQSLAFYLLAGFKKNSIFSTESGLKYFIIGSFSSGFLLFGFSILYGLCGFTNFEDFSTFMVNNHLNENLNLLNVALTFILTSIFFKLSAAPFHLWSPDIYEGSPSNSTIFFAVVPKISILVALIRIFQHSFYESMLFLNDYITVIAILSIFVGSLAALKQRKVKSLLAYSSISHVGYLLLAFSAYTSQGTQALLFYIIVYILTSICIWSIFLCTTSVKYYLTKVSKQLSDFTFLSVVNPSLGLTFTVAILSLAGIPPLIGFYAKAIIFLSAFDAYLYVSAVVGILISVISTFYYLRMIKVVYFEKLYFLRLYLPVSYETAILTSSIFISFLFLFLNPNLITLLCYKMSLFL